MIRDKNTYSLRGYMLDTLWFCHSIHQFSHMQLEGQRQMGGIWDDLPDWTMPCKGL
jgi:hypothetical protein